jgi:hypothetical protein
LDFFSELRPFASLNFRALVYVQQANLNPSLTLNTSNIIYRRKRHSQISQPSKEDVMATPQTLLADDSQLPLPSTKSSPATPRRSTVAAFPTTTAYIPRYQMRSLSGQCTHLTMTRLYTTEFRCSMCFRAGSMGWVYRCTQDRELVLEDDMERGDEVSHIKTMIPS